MAAGILLTYDTLTLTTAEIISFTYEKNFEIIIQSTIGDKQLTSPANLSPAVLNVEAYIRDNASTKFTSWNQKIGEKPLFDLNFLQRNFGKYYLTSITISSDELDDFGDVLRFSLSAKFLSNQNF